MSLIRDGWRASAQEFLKYSELLSYYPKITSELISEIPTTTRYLIDFGCGYGRLTRAYLNKPGADGAKGLKIFLVDNSPKMLELTLDLSDNGDVKFIRLCDDERLEKLPSQSVGKIDTIACNSSIHLLRNDDLSINLDPFFKRCHGVLRPGGCMVASIPDQAYEFGDGWKSQFHMHAASLWGDSQARSQVPKLNDELLQAAAQGSGFRAHIRFKSLKLTWDDFLNFYRIPAMGGSRIPHLTQQERLVALAEVSPRFEEIGYRWVFIKFQKAEL